MKKIRNGKWIAAVGAALLFLFSFIFSMGGGIFGVKENGGISSSDPISVSADDSSYISYPNGSGDLGRFVNGYQYLYTDKDLMANMHAGKITEDMKTVIVAHSDDSTWGKSASDPYVIATIEDWEVFVQKLAKDTAFGSGKFFTLANDLDFSSLPSTVTQFHMAGIFQGTFYGLGHSLRNISCSNWVYFDKATSTYKTVTASANYSDGGFGIFGKLNNAVITDLMVENFSFTNVPQVASLSGGWVGSSVGGIAGVSYGTSYILNCQTGGEIAHVTYTASNTAGTFGWPAGILGCHKGVMYIYRCSAELTVVTPTNANFHPTGAGIVGEVYDQTGARASCYIYDCAANVTAQTSTTGHYSHFGAAVGYSNGNITVENFVGTLDISPDNILPHSGALGGGSYCGGLKNIYVDGKQGAANAASKLNMGMWMLSTTQVNTNDVRVGSSWHARYQGGWTPAQTTHGSRAALLAAAKAAVGAASKLPAAIWNAENVDKTDYTPENSPVRHKIEISVAYYNYTTGGETPFDITAAGAKTVSKGDSLYEPTAQETGANRKFVGWTTDQTGKGEVFTAVPVWLLGENKLYAVWELDQKNVEIIASGQGLKDDPDTGKTLVYNGNGLSDGIRLTANLTAEGMTDPEITYQWEKDGTAIATGGTGEIYRVQNVRDSGEYTVTLKVHSAYEPLFRAELKASPVKATVLPATLDCTGADFKEGEHPYSGAPYKTAVPDARVFDESGNAVDGTTKWAIELGFFNGEGATVADGVEKKEIEFTPDEKYNGNYGDAVRFEIEFEIEYLTFTFSIPEYNKLELKINLEYGQNYTYNNIATMFEDAFKPYMGDPSLGGYTPAFLVNGQRIKINDYRKLGNTAYPTVKESYSLTVGFDPQSYKVTFDPRNGTSDIITEEIGHGIRLSKPTDPTYGMQLFLGWFYEFTDDDGKKTERAWNFDSDRVTRETELYAKWLNADTLVDLKVEVSPIAEFNAQQSIDPSMLTVKAVFEGSAEGQTLTQEALLSFGQYEIEYVGRLDGKLHINADGSPTQVKISYTYRKAGQAAQTKEYLLELDVTPIALDTSKLKPYFKDTAVVGDGTEKSIKITTSIGSIIKELKSVSYLYLDSSGQPMEGATGATDLGTYTVIAKFTALNADYSAPDIQATLSIIEKKVQLNVTWDNTEFTYNGKVQVPTPTFTDDLGNVIEAHYTLEGDVDATDANNSAKPQYTVKIVLSEESIGYEIKGLGATVRFSIAKARIAVPKQLKEFEYQGKDFDLNNLDPELYLEYFEGFDPALMKAVDGNVTAMDAGRYNASVRLLNPACAEWEDGGSSSVNMPWAIKKAKLTVNWDKFEFVKNNGVQAPQVSSFYTLYGEDKNAVDYINDIQYTGDIAPTDVGNYSITVIIKSGVGWAKNYELDETKSWTFVIVPESGLDILTIEWDSNILFKFNGEVQRPVYKIMSRMGNDVTDAMRDYIQWNDEALKSKWAGDYTATVSLNAAGQSKYFLSGKTSCVYTIALNDNGEGANPENPGNNGGGDNPITGTVELPLWQLIVGGVSAILFLICTARSFGEYGKYKAAKREAKELAAMSYSVTYGFAPLPLLAIAFLGASETVWTAIACSALGLFLLSFAAMLLLGKKRKAAELVVRREKARIEEEKEYARQEEQQRRDNEFKMMFAAMQQNYQQPQMQYDDMRSLLAETVSALLPAMSQMQALPPAQSDANAYGAPQPQPQAGYGAPQQQFGEASPETEALRAQMAQQQAQMAAQQAQMAQQQELINQLLQNQTQAASAQAYDEAAAAADEAFWIDESEKIVSLEELYGKLSDDAKRCYYEIGSYIMNKPRTMQNDGKYAVLFKYRGKTLFKLCIKEDAPVLYYSTDDGGKSEVRINGAETLEAARKVVDLRIAQTDSELGAI